MNKTGAEMIFHKRILDAGKRLLGRRSLSDYVNTISVFFEHFLKPAHLPLDNLEAADKFLFCLIHIKRVYTPWGYRSSHAVDNRL